MIGLRALPSALTVSGLVNVLPMSEEELRAAIEEPALRTGREFEPGLVARILEEVAGEPGNLPLLEFALTELWDLQTAGRRLTHEAYEAIGEVEGAIARRAEAVYGALEKEGQGERRPAAVDARLSCPPLCLPPGQVAPLIRSV